MKKKLAFVLSGGGSRGALQVGALQALLESGLQPDLLVGTSIGAVNATFLALHGFSKSGLDLLAATWRKAATLDLLPSNYVQRTERLGCAIRPLTVSGKRFRHSGILFAPTFATRQPQI
jgi:NTE family protein